MGPGKCVKTNKIAFLSSTCLLITPTRNWKLQVTLTVSSIIVLKSALCIFGSHIWNFIAEVRQIKHKLISKASLMHCQHDFVFVFRMLDCFEVLMVKKTILRQRGRAAPLARASAWITGLRLTVNLTIWQSFYNQLFFFATPSFVVFQEEVTKSCRDKHDRWTNPWPTWQFPSYATLLRFLLLDKNHSNVPSSKEVDEGLWTECSGLGCVVRWINQHI